MAKERGRDPLTSYTWAIAACLLASGAASLTLEVVWSRLLKLVFGSTTLAISTILVAYMLGLGLGGLLGGRLAARLRNGLRAYGWIEIGIGVYALLVPTLLSLFPLANRLVLGALPFWPAALVRFLLVLIVLLAPTILMGATLPVLVQALVHGRGCPARRVGLFYGLNTLGAVCGVFGATFLLFPAVGLRTTNLVGAGTALVIGLVTLLWIAPAYGRVKGSAEIESASLSESVPQPDGYRRWDPLLISYGLVGFTALAYEVCRTRCLTMIFGSSIYAFATILGAFLLGIALGSLIVRLWIDRLRSYLLAYGLGLALLGLTAYGTLLMFRKLPSLLESVFATRGISGGTLVLAGLQASVLVVLAPTFVLGALFPLISRALAGRRPELGRTIGEIYFVNTVGSALGAFLAGFVLIPTLGLRGTLGLCIAINLASAVAILAWRRQVGGLARWVPAGAVAVVAALVLLNLPVLSGTWFTDGAYYRPKKTVKLGIEMQPVPGYPDNETLYYREGVNATVSVHRTPSGIDLRINGKTDASLLDMSTQVLLGHLPMLFGRVPASRALVIGGGSGVTAGAVTLHAPERIDLVELEPAVLEASRYFDDVNHRPLQHEALHVILDDGRNFLSSTARTYDVITSEPSNPWISGVSNLFTREAFGAARRALRPGGRFLQWIPLYGMDLEIVQSLLLALRAEFPYVYGFRHSSSAGDLLLLATLDELTRADLPVWDSISTVVRRDLEQIGVNSTADLWSMLVLRPEEIDGLIEDATVSNTD
ncbi:hypothetical protein DRQ32_11350, partial [bacterium]